MKLAETIQVKNKQGLHIRPAALIVKVLQNCKSKVFFTYKKSSVNARSIMSILTLVAKKNAKIDVFIEGPDAKRTMQKLKDVFTLEFKD